MFALINDNQLVLGPIEFNYRLFNSVLEEELEVDYKLKPSDYAQVPILINENIKILNAVEDIPVYDPKVEDISLYKYEVLDDKVVFYYESKQKDINLIKNDYKNTISSERWHRENIGYITTIVNGVEINVSTSRESRVSLITKLSSGNGPYNFKFGKVWIEITGDDIREIISKIDQKVQEYFDWEYSKLSEIDNCTTISDIENIDFFNLENRIQNTISASPY